MTDMVDYREVEGIRVYPFTIARLEKLAPVFDALIKKLKSAGIDLSSLMKEGASISNEAIAKMVLTAIGEIGEVIAVCTEMESEKVRNLDLGTVSALALTIMSMNVVYLKNAFTPAKTIMQEVLKKN